MYLIPNPKPVDLDAFEAPDDLADVKYGLPRHVHFCMRCVISKSMIIFQKK